MLLKQGEIFEQGTRDKILTENVLSNFYPKPIKILPITNNRFAVYPAEL